MPQRWSFPPSWRWLGSASPGPFVVLGDSRLPVWALETLHGSVEADVSLPWIEGGAGFRAAEASAQALARVRLACPVTPFELEALVSRPSASLTPGAPFVVLSDPLSVFAEPDAFGPVVWRAYLRFLEGLKRLPVPAIVLDLALGPASGRASPSGPAELDDVLADSRVAGQTSSPSLRSGLRAQASLSAPRAEGEARRSSFRARLLRDARALARLGREGLEPVYKRVARDRPACASC